MDPRAAPYYTVGSACSTPKWLQPVAGPDFRTTCYAGHGKIFTDLNADKPQILGDSRTRRLLNSLALIQLELSKVERQSL